MKDSWFSSVRRGEIGSAKKELARRPSRFTLRKKKADMGNIDALEPSSGKSALHLAVESGDVYMAEWLLDAGSDPELPTTMQERSIHLAALASNADMVRILIKHNVNRTSLGPRNKTALHYAAEANNGEIIDLLTGLMKAEKGAKSEINVDVVDEERNTPLHLAAAGNKVKAISALVRAGASLGVRDARNRTPVELAQTAEARQAIRVLEHVMTDEQREALLRESKARNEAVSRRKILNAPTYYAVMELDRSATASEIKKAYRKLALKYHPDKNKTPEAKIKFHQVSLAFSVLGDETKRIIYDENGAGAVEELADEVVQDEAEHGNLRVPDDIEAIFKSMQTTLDDAVGRSPSSTRFNAAVPPASRSSMDSIHRSPGPASPEASRTNVASPNRSRTSVGDAAVSRAPVSPKTSAANLNAAELEQFFSQVGVPVMADDD